MNAIKKLFRLVLDESIPYGEVMVTEELDACAIWVPPGVWSKRPPVTEYLRTLPQTIPLTGWRRLRRYIDVDLGEYAKKPDKPHAYLVFLGVRPDRRGLGLASMLLEEKLRLLDAAGMPAYLENSNESNLRLYQRHGFKLVDSFKQKNGGPTEWCMWREPVSRQPQRA